MSTQFGKYVLQRKLAEGGMAELFLAKQEGMEGFEKLVVVKRILPQLCADDSFVRMFLNEARVAARLNHPNVVQIFDLGKLGEQFFIAMEYVHGEDLRAVIREATEHGARLPLGLCCRILADAMAGLHYAHTRAGADGKPLGLVHRDVSPQNVLVTYEGGVKIVDFGIAKATREANAAQTQAGLLKGKYAYMSPEQARGLPIDARADVFCAGILLWEMVTWQRLFKRSTEMATLMAVAEEPIRAPITIDKTMPVELNRIIVKALERNPDERFQSAQELRAALEALIRTSGWEADAMALSDWVRGLFANKLRRQAEDIRAAGLASLEDFLLKVEERTSISWMGPRPATHRPTPSTGLPQTRPVTGPIAIGEPPGAPARPIPSPTPSPLTKAPSPLARITPTRTPPPPTRTPPPPTSAAAISAAMSAAFAGAMHPGAMHPGAGGSPPPGTPQAGMPGSSPSGAPQASAPGSSPSGAPQAGAPGSSPSGTPSSGSPSPGSPGSSPAGAAGSSPANSPQPGTPSGAPAGGSGAIALSGAAAPGGAPAANGAASTPSPSSAAAATPSATSPSTPGGFGWSMPAAAGWSTTGLRTPLPPASAAPRTPPPATSPAPRTPPPPTSASTGATASAGAPPPAPQTGSHRPTPTPVMTAATTPAMAAIDAASYDDGPTEHVAPSFDDGPTAKASPEMLAAAAQAASPPPPAPPGEFADDGATVPGGGHLTSPTTGSVARPRRPGLPAEGQRFGAEKSTQKHPAWAEPKTPPLKRVLVATSAALAVVAVALVALWPSSEPSVTPAESTTPAASATDTPAAGATAAGASNAATRPPIAHPGAASASATGAPPSAAAASPAASSPNSAGAGAVGSPPSSAASSPTAAATNSAGSPPNAAGSSPNAAGSSPTGASASPNAGSSPNAAGSSPNAASALPAAGSPPTAAGSSPNAAAAAPAAGLASAGSSTPRPSAYPAGDSSATHGAHLAATAEIDPPVAAGTAMLVIHTDAPANITIDGRAQPLGTSATVTVQPGIEHVVTVQRPGHSLRRLHVPAMAPGERMPLHFNLR